MLSRGFFNFPHFGKFNYCMDFVSSIKFRTSKFQVLFCSLDLAEDISLTAIFNTFNTKHSGK